MQKIITYVRASAALFILMFMISASGFTFHIHHCSMGDDTPHACCEMASQIEVTRMDPPNSGDSPALDETTEPCCKTFIAGGLNAAPSIHEIPARPAIQERILFFYPTIKPILFTANLTPFNHIFNTDEVYQLSGEKCALTSVFLI